MTKNFKGRSFSVWMSNDHIDRLDGLAERGGLKRNKLIANILEAGIKAFEAADIERFNIEKLKNDFLRDLAQSLKTKA